jgi:hypothetical protein
MRFKKQLIFLACLIFGAATQLFAQTPVFGKNKVRSGSDDYWTYKVCLPQEKHCRYEFRVGFDVKDERTEQFLARFVHHMNASYATLAAAWKQDIGKTVVVYLLPSHRMLEEMNITDAPSLPEGIRGLATTHGSCILDNQEYLIVLKADDTEEDLHATAFHELVHAFEYSRVGWQFLNCSEESLYRRPWVYESVAVYLTDVLGPGWRTSMRRRMEEMAAAYHNNPQFGIPTLEMLHWDYRQMAGRYVFGPMVFLYLEHRYGREATVQFAARLFDPHEKTWIFPILQDLAQGAFRTLAEFDTAHRNYWAEKFAPLAKEYVLPNTENEFVASRKVMPAEWPYPVVSPQVTPDGTAIGFITIVPKVGEVLARVPALPREDMPYLPNLDRRERVKTARKAPHPMRILTPYAPGERYDSLTAQGLNTTPRGGGRDFAFVADDSWSDAVRAASALVALRRTELGRTHALRPPTPRKKDQDYKRRMKAFTESLRQSEAPLRDAQQTLVALRSAPGMNRAYFFAKDARGNVLVEQDANTRKILNSVRVSLEDPTGLALAPDGKVVNFSAATSSPERDIYSMPTDGSAPPTKVTSDGAWNGAPALSPDGTKLVYVSTVRAHQKLMLRDLTTGATEQLTHGAWDDVSPAWSSDGAMLVFTTEEYLGVPSIATLDLATRTVSRWATFQGGTYTPSFYPGENDRVVATIMSNEQYQNRVFPVMTLYDIRLKSPQTVSVIRATHDAPAVAQTADTPALDRTQLVNRKAPERNVKFLDGQFAAFGTTNQNQFALAGTLLFGDISGDVEHRGGFALSKHLRIAQYDYFNKAGRATLHVGGKLGDYPLLFGLAGLWGRFPRYPEPYGDTYNWNLGFSRVRERQAFFGLRYPLDKQKRVEVGANITNRDYRLRREIPDERPSDIPAEIYDTDRRIADHLNALDRQTHGSVSFAYVEDKTVGSSEVFGPLHGRALRMEAKLIEVWGNGSATCGSFAAHARQYVALTPRTLLAFRADGLYSTCPTGDLWIQGGDVLRTYPYSSVFCDRCFTTSTEFRFPVGDVLLFDQYHIKVRGSFFADSSIGRMSLDFGTPWNEWAFGGGLLFVFGPLPVNFECARTPHSSGMQCGARVGYSF